MKRLQCDGCGGTDFKEGVGGTLECTHCGAKFLSDSPADAPKSDIERTLEDYYIVEPTLDPAENVRKVLRHIGNIRGIATDIYKGISIRSVTEKYVTLCLLKAKYRLDWSITACYRRYENQTVYKEKYEYVNGVRHTWKEPVTEKVERIDRVPKNGTHVYDAEDLFLASENLKNGLKGVSDGISYDVITGVEQLLDGKYNNYVKTHPDYGKAEIRDGQYYYNGIIMDLDFNKALVEQKASALSDRAGTRAAENVAAGFNCDFYEVNSAIQKTLSKKKIKVCVPVQIIEYEYKGKAYTAITDLVAWTGQILMTYPHDIELDELENDLQSQQEKSKKNGVLTGGFWAFGLTIALLLYAMITDAQDEWVIYAMLGGFIVSLVLLIAGWVIKSMREDAFQDYGERMLAEYFAPRKAAIAKSKDAFFNAYTDYASALSAAANIDCIETSRFEARYIETDDSKVPEEEFSERSIPKTLAEDRIKTFGIMGLTPYTFIMGPFALCFVSRAKMQNGGVLSKKAKTFLCCGVIGAIVWIILFIAIFSSI